jgi:3-hydroxy-D-aspartate aldolase
MRVAELPTPALLVDIDVLQSNIQRMSAHAENAGKRLRPHVKAHKCVQIARRQVEAGAAGICVATVPEAELMGRAGIESLLLTSPVADLAKCERMVALCRLVPDVAVVIDHPEQVELYARSANDAGCTLKILVDLDVGDHRTGVPPGEPAFELVKAILLNRSLTFHGLQAYSVRASHMSEAEGRESYNSGALECALHTQQILESHSIATPVITGGSTGSYADDSKLAYLTELQAGSYALMDGAYARIGIKKFGHALTVLATVVSANHPDRVTVDAGFKAFATDRPFGPDLKDNSSARYQWAGDEFGYIFFENASNRLRLGDRVKFVPPHCDPTVNLYDRIYACRGYEVEEIWPVMDRYHEH